MPEGHSVHRLARAFSRCFAGKVVDASSPQGRFGAGAALLDGRVLLAAEAHGKQMFLGFSGDMWLRVHLGLYGMWRFQGSGLEGIGRRRHPLAEEAEFPPLPRGLVRLRLVAGRHLADLSGPTACEVLSTMEKHAFTRRMGEDPLRPDADPARAYVRLHASRSAIGLLLMRQDIIAGIGNIYRAELLYRHGVSPFREGREVEPEVVDAMWDDLVVLMKDGVRRGRIVTVDPDDRGALADLDTDRPASDDPGLDGGEDTPTLRRRRRETGVYVYRRSGRTCLRCGSIVADQEWGGRRLFWCPGCQI